MFSHSYFLGKLSQKTLFFDILDRKECFLDQKSEVLKKFKKSKISKAVSPCFFFKNSNVFSWVLFGQINPKKFVFSCSGQKGVLFRPEKLSLVRCLWSKIGNFVLFFLAKQLKTQCFVTLYMKKKPFQTIKTPISKSRNFCIFPSGLVYGFWSKIGNFLLFCFSA